MQDADYQLYTDSVAAEVMLGRIPSEEIKKRARDALDSFGLTQYSDRHPASLSGGQKQRVTLAAAYCADVPLVILDEPTSGLDGDGVLTVANWTRQLAAQGKTVLIILHDSLLVDLACDELIELAGEKEGLLIWATLFSSLSVLLSLLPYLSVYYVLVYLLENAASVTSDLNKAQLIRYAFMGLGGLVLGLASMYIGGMCSHVAAFRILYGIRMRLTEHIAKLPLVLDEATAFADPENEYKMQIAMQELIHWENSDYDCPSAIDDSSRT
ncbi:unnamed protein product, partial [Mesorhabditis spiculigera]